MKQKLKSALANENGKHIFPFFWQHGEDDETLLRELHSIYDCGIRSVCVESRPHEGFGTESWYEDMALILAECERLGMEFWLLDDKHFPTGRANHLMINKYPEMGKREMFAHVVDVSGPVRDCGVMCGCADMTPGSELIAVVACKRVPRDPDMVMTGTAVDLTDKYDPENNMVFFDLPEGLWRVFVIFHRPSKSDFIDMLREEAVQVLIEAVYEPHYQRFGRYFGTTFRGYFSDEPYVMHGGNIPKGKANASREILPWNDNVKRELAAVCPDWKLQLPKLWFPAEGDARIRVHYMDVVTKLYAEHFAWQLGNWCRQRGVEYIGHIIEDNGKDTQFGSGGHFYRALDGQDMAGIDVVLGQIMPGMNDDKNSLPCGYKFGDNKMFHYGLAKMAASHSHIQPQKKGRTMCEIYGAYGWAEGLPFMKWLTDHMLVRGVNHFVPHAFSPKYPDPDCPPHFYNGGHNPEYYGFGTLMGYMERVAGILSDGRHHASAAILYHAQAEWSGKPYMKVDDPAKALLDEQIDFDIVPEDYLDNCVVENRVLKLSGEDYKVFVVPRATMLPRAVVEKLCGFAREGLSVWCVGSKPEYTCEGDPIPQDMLARFEVIELDKLPAAIRYRGYEDVTAVGENSRWLRVYHYSRNGGHVLMLTNEGIHGPVKVKLKARDFRGGDFVRYDAMENKAVRDRADREFDIDLPVYGSELLFFGDIDMTGIPDKEEKIWNKLPLGKLAWNVSFAAPEDYKPGDTCPAPFGEEQTLAELVSIVRLKKRFAGFVRYETELTVPGKSGDKKQYCLDLGRVGEVAYVWVNGEKLGERIIPPYRFCFEAEAGEKLQLCVVTTSHLGYEQQDGFSAYMTFEPVGLLGPVALEA